MAKEIILADWLMKKLPPAERFHEILRFLIVGGGCFLWNMCFCTCLLSLQGFLILPLQRLHSLFLCWWIIYFVWRWFFTRKTDENGNVSFLPHLRQAWGINQMTMWFFVEIAGLWYMFAKVIASGIVMIWNYATKRYILKRESIKKRLRRIVWEIQFRPKSFLAAGEIIF